MIMAYMHVPEVRHAKAIGKDLSISTKAAIEVCNFLRGKPLDRAVTILEGVKRKEQAVPFRRFTDGVGHRKGMAAGRYPVKAASEFLILLESARANAENLGLTGDLIVSHIAANRASRPLRNRSKYRGEFKRTHVEVILVEGKAKTAPAKKEKTEKQTPKTPEKSEKPEPKKEEPKAEEKPKEQSEKPKEEPKKSEEQKSKESKKPEEPAKQDAKDVKQDGD